MSSALTLIAGPKALQHIRNRGLKANDFNLLAGASGGPKWFILFGLDKYLSGEFFKDRSTPLHTLGSSAGAWRMACFAQNDPVAAITRLAEHYSQERYSDKPDVAEITAKARLMVQTTLGANGAAEVAAHPSIRTHILADRCRGPAASEKVWLQLFGLALAAGANTLSRRALGLFFERVLFHTGAEPALQLKDLPTRTAPLHAQNLEQALMASGAIPLVLSGVSGITDAPKGVYRDGGILDYHFDLPFNQSQGLVLYPHFSQQVTPGWLDKKLPYRRVDPRHYDNVLMLAPSRDLVAKLPYGKISDRNDFKHLDADSRLKYWRTVLQEGERMADALHEMVATGKGLDDIQPFQP
ncbi:patatin-like phospholipase family protein [Hahella sp. KA22]|uniref:patatin-like phospholipase family protein n=1 Tax=Hahella sp. KA22 TaxID=1628392 RepID=UPI000FDEDBD8|nr:patatin-like phospholipase family protein [Hahella sp. KA22]AZZ95089.1 patatin-like phospholipase family protein [Hahella sp. KA22]QAY52734.1 patatin-like phospholipase family protein [Hahella sp. KA22]